VVQADWRVREVHTVSVRLRVRAHEARGINQRLFALGQLRNAVVRDARRRVEMLREDPGWRSHARISDARERQAAYSRLRHEYGVGEIATRELACAHWNASGWMSDLLDRRAANALGREVWQSVEAWLYRGGGRPRTRHPRERNIAEGNDLNGGLVLKNGRLAWSTQAINRSNGRLGRKRLDLTLDWSCLATAQRAYVHAHLFALRRVGIRRDVVRGRARYWALLCLDCAPYRSQDYQERLARRPQAILGLDMGPTEQAWATDQAAGIIRLGDEALARAARSIARERRTQRALDRSRRAANPDCYDVRGRAIRGRRPRKLSRHGRQLAAEHAETKRKAAAQRRQATIAQVRQAALRAPVVRVEDQSLRSWQAGGYGSRMHLTTPGAFLARLDRELKLTKGRVERLPLRSAFSQCCVCGRKQRKPRSQNWHECEHQDCPIRGIRLHRHLFSAWLMHVTASPQSGGIPGLHEGTLATLLRRDPVLQDSLVKLCATRRGRDKHPEGGRFASEGAAGRSADEAKPTPALPARTRRADALGNAALPGLGMATRPSPRQPRTYMCSCAGRT
jgi:putative transposase